MRRAKRDDNFVSALRGVIMQAEYCRYTLETLYTISSKFQDRQLTQPVALSGLVNRR